ncbi:MAG: hypothetical protein SOW06_03045 [Succinivibrionaceae bacterium]|nr:hypothetical protein [Succinivibrionaceae bacterium]MDY6337517.1 hypothetical protein [Succinivibrionaceae bacterium]MDY6376464.1 hypothetical protein [Succinivibrionaceae bacterium]
MALPSGYSDEMFLEALRITEHGIPTLAGLLYFGISPQCTLPSLP